MTYEQKRKLQLIIDTYGTKTQIDMAIEECSELTKALLKARRGNDEPTVLRDAIIDEIADVTIMLEQLKIIYNCTEAVNNRIEYKINRQIERLRNNE